MVIKKLNISMFRNIRHSTLEFGERFNLFHGKNGEGKTNYLEALFFLGTLKSFRNAKQREMLLWNESNSLLGCSIVDNGLCNELSVSFENSSKILKMDGKNSTRALDYCKMLSIVAFAPEEINMIAGSPEQRRRYLDRAIFSSDPGYLKKYHDYYRTLKQRNHLLKQKNYASMGAWTEQLATAGARLAIERSAYLQGLLKVFPEFYKNISGSDEAVSLCYHNPSYAEGFAEATVRDNLLERINSSKSLERERGTTVYGPHRDDLEFFLNGRLIREHGSHGQQKSFVLALKMAEIEYLGRIQERIPVMLLDDMTAELDSSRVEHLMDFILKRDMQVFITTTDPASLPRIATAGSSVFRVESGRIV